jgi:hypothetical protein
MTQERGLLEGLRFRSTSNADIAWKALAAFLLLFCVRYFSSVLAHPSVGSFMDFSVFYCGARAIAEHVVPYGPNALRACEAAVTPWRHSVLPVTIPPYALLLIYPISLLPFGIAAIVWLVGLGLAVCASCVIIARLARAPLVVAVAAFACTAWFPSMIAGSLAPYPIFFLLLAAYWIECGRWGFAAAALGLAMVMPNVAIASCVACFIAFPRIRAPLAVVALVLLAAQSLFTDPVLLVRYFPALHQHAVSEISNAWQYSLAYFLHMIGVSDAAAVNGGFLQYVVACGVGCTIGIVLCKRRSEFSWAVLAPMAFSVAGGIYSRQQELSIAIPFCVMLAYRTQSHLARYALVLLATPWSAVYGDTSYPPFAMLSTATLVHQLWKPHWLVTICAAFAAAAAVASLYPQNSNTVNSNVAWFAKHLPAWLGLATMSLGGLLALAQPRTAPVPAASS